MPTSSLPNPDDCYHAWIAFFHCEKMAVHLRLADQEASKPIEVPKGHIDVCEKCGAVSYSHPYLGHLFCKPNAVIW